MLSNWVLYLLGLANALNMLITPIFMLFMMVTVVVGMILLARGVFGSRKDDKS